MTRSQTDIQIQKLQTELERLREEENVLQEVISLVKSQLSAVQVRGRVHCPPLCQGCESGSAFFLEAESEVALV